MLKNLPFFTFFLILANLLVYLLELGGGGLPVCEAFGLVPAHFMKSGAVAPLFTSLFLHDPAGLAHIAGNMAALALFGAVVESDLGHLRFLGLYLAAGVLGGLMHVQIDPSSTSPLVGASGAIFGLLAVAGVLRPRLLGFVVTFAAVEIWHAFTGGDAHVSFGCHIGGLCAGFLVAVLLRVSGHEALEAA